MLSLQQPTKEILENHYKSLKDRVENALLNSRLSHQAKEYLTPSKIYEILLSKPERLLNFHNELIPKLSTNFTLAIYENYINAKKTPEQWKTQEQMDLVTIYNPIINELANVFDYDSFISGHKITSYKLAKALNRNTCTYCNRLYTITIEERDKDTGRFNDENRITRPQFDHWYSKKKYPVLALSFYNLIPSCSVCNSSIKGDTAFDLSTHHHPYLDKMFNEFKFTFKLKNVHESNVRIIVVGGSKTVKTLNEFKILEIYNGHSGLELTDMLELKFKYSEDYLRTLFNDTFKSLHVSEKEAYRLVFGVEFEDEFFHKRPFSKFKKDILGELRRIDRESS
jgi:hypothetical protein